MIEMTPELKKQLLDLGRNAVNDSETESEIIQKLIINARQVVKNTIRKRELLECKVRYIDTRNPELLLWAVGLICERWVLYLIEEKAIKGHCYTHKKQTEMPCKKSYQFHHKMFEEVKKSFKRITNHKYQREIKKNLVNIST